MTETIDITPDVQGIKRWVLHVARTDMRAAVLVAAELPDGTITLADLANSALGNPT